MHRRLLLASKSNYPINTIIGGVASTITSKSALATKLGIAEDLIRKFEIVGNDVRANIRGRYILGVMGIATFQNDRNITSFLDLDGLVTDFASSNCFNFASVQNVYLPSLTTLRGFDFYNTSSLTSLYLPNVISSTDISTVNRHFYNTRVPILNLPRLISIGQLVTFRQMTATNEINMRRLKILGNPAIHDDCFTMLKLNCIIRVNIALASANSGNPNAALVWAKNNRNATVEFYDDNGNYVSTL